MDFHLEPEQTELVRELLDSAYRDLRYEIANTDNSEYKAMLRAREHALAEILDLFGGPIPVA
jgi:hypothetical protein